MNEISTKMMTFAHDGWRNVKYVSKVNKLPCKKILKIMTYDNETTIAMFPNKEAK